MICGATGAAKIGGSPPPFWSLRRKPSFSISNTERSFFFIRSMIALMSFSSKRVVLSVVLRSLGKAVLITGSSHGLVVFRRQMGGAKGKNPVKLGSNHESV